MKIDLSKPLTKEQYMALQTTLEGLEMDIAQGHDTPEGDLLMKQIEDAMSASDWTMHPDYGVVLKRLIGAPGYE